MKLCLVELLQFQIWGIPLFSSLKSRKLRTQRGIDLDDSLKRSKMYALEKRLDEMDLTAGVLVFPLEVQSSNSSLPGYKGNLIPLIAKVKYSKRWSVDDASFVNISN